MILKNAARSKKAPTLRAQRNQLMRMARITDSDRLRSAYVGLARSVNHNLTRSHIRASWRVAEFRAVLESLT
jgi:hypothetical protein